MKIDSARVDYSWMVHDIPGVVHNQGPTQWSKLIRQRLEESEGLVDSSGKPLKVVCFLEGADTPLDQARLISQYSREGLSPTAAVIAAKIGIDPQEARRGNGSLTYRAARRQAAATINPETMQELALLTDFHENILYKGRVQLEIEGVTQEMLDALMYGPEEMTSERREERAKSIFALQEMDNALQLLQDAEWEEAMHHYQQGVLSLAQTTQNREQLLLERIRSAAEDPSTYAVIVRFGAGHARLGQTTREMGLDVSDTFDADYRGRAFELDTIGHESIHEMLRDTETSNIPEIKWWQALISEFLVGVVASQVGTHGDFYGKRREAEKAVCTYVQANLQTMEDVHTYKSQIEQHLQQGYDAITAALLTTRI